MILLIDGYNVIHRARLSLSQPLEKQRNELIQVAADFQSKKNVQIVIFFDNKSKNEFWERPEHPEVKVIFSASADDAIVEYLSSCKKPERVEVVSDDKSVRERSKHLGARVISTGEMMHRFLPKRYDKPPFPRESRPVSEKPATQERFDEINKTLPW